jgi:hypothetical protein
VLTRPLSPPFAPPPATAAFAGQEERERRIKGRLHERAATDEVSQLRRANGALVGRLSAAADDRLKAQTEAREAAARLLRMQAALPHHHRPATRTPAARLAAPSHITPPGSPACHQRPHPTPHRLAPPYAGSPPEPHRHPATRPPAFSFRPRRRTTSVRYAGGPAYRIEWAR